MKKTKNQECDASAALGVWCPLVGLAAVGLEAIAGMCFENFNLDSNVWKPAHLWLAPCWTGQALTLVTQHKVAVAFARRKRAPFDAKKKNSSRRHSQTLREWSARTTNIRKKRCASQAASYCERRRLLMLLPGQGLPRAERLQR